MTMAGAQRWKRNRPFVPCPCDNADNQQVERDRPLKPHPHYNANDQRWERDRLTKDWYFFWNLSP